MTRSEHAEGDSDVLGYLLGYIFRPRPACSLATLRLQLDILGDILGYILGYISGHILGHILGHISGYILGDILGYI